MDRLERIVEENFKLALLSIREQKATLAEVSQRLTGKIGEVDGKIGEVDGKIGEVSGKLGELSGKLKELSSEVAAGFEQMDQVTDNIESSLGNAFNSVKLVAAGLAEIRQEMAEFDRRLSEVEEKRAS